jgi:hypothetical protein
LLISNGDRDLRRELTMKIILRVIASISLLLLASFASRAELVNFEIVEIELPRFDGRSHLGADRLFNRISHDHDGARPLDSPSKRRAESKMQSLASTAPPRGHVRSPHVRKGSTPNGSDGGLKI